MLVSHVLTEPDIHRLNDARLFFSNSDAPRLYAGHQILFDDQALIEPYAAILAGVVVPTIGAFSYCWSPFNAEDINISIGRYCSLAGDVAFIPANHPIDFVSTSSFSVDRDFPIFRHAMIDVSMRDFPRHTVQQMREGRERSPVIGHDVWIGQGVALGRGITLGTGSVVGSSAMVTRSVPPYAIVGGNPARIIRMRFPDNIIELLLESRWWEYRFTDFVDLPYQDPERFVGELQEKAAKGGMDRIPPARTLTDILKLEQ